MGLCAGAQIMDALDLLHSAEAAMRSAEQEVRAGATPDAGPLRAEIALLKKDTAAMCRVIDAAGALNRGLALRLGCVTPGYAPPGRTPLETAPASMCEVQG